MGSIAKAFFKRNLYKKLIINYFGGLYQLQTCV